MIKAGCGSTTSSRQSFVTDILPPRRLAVTIFHPDRARAATQLAVWMLNGTTHRRTYSYTTAQGKTKSGHFTADNEVVAAARWLHDSAKSGSIKAAPHRARRYLGAVSGGSKRQDMLYVLPAVSVSFQKPVC